MVKNYGKTCVIGTVLVLAIAIVIMVAISLEKLDSDEVGIMYDTVKNYMDPTARFEGLHNGAPGFEFIIFPSVFRTFEFNHLGCLNRDGVRTYLSISYQYRVRPNKLYYIVVQFKDHSEFKDVLSAIGESSLHDACSRFNTSQFQAERGAFQEDLRKRLVSKYDVIDCDVTDLQVINIERPKDYENSVRSKEEAREDINVAENERPRRLTAADTSVREAATTAGIIIDKAESDARIVINRAEKAADAIIVEYEKEAEAYLELFKADGLNLSVEGFLSYLSVRTIEDAKNPVHINMKAPARTNWQPNTK